MHLEGGPSTFHVITGALSDALRQGHCKPLIPGSTQSSQLCDLRREFIRLQLIDSTFANSSGRQFWWKRYVTLVPHDRIARHAVISKSPDSWQLSSRQKQSAQTPHRVRSRKSVKNVSKADSTIDCCSGTPQRCAMIGIMRRRCPPADRPEQCAPDVFSHAKTRG